MVEQQKHNDLLNKYRKSQFELKKLLQQKRKKLQFSQKMTFVSAIFSMVFVVLMNLANFILLWNDKQPMPQETVMAMSIYGGITSTLTFGGYLVLSGVRDCSKNKHAKELKEAERG